MDNKGLHKNAVFWFFVVPVILVFPRNIDSHGFFQEFINVHAKPCVHADFVNSSKKTAERLN